MMRLVLASSFVVAFTATAFAAPKAAPKAAAKKPVVASKGSTNPAPAPAPAPAAAPAPAPAAAPAAPAPAAAPARPVDPLEAMLAQAEANAAAPRPAVAPAPAAKPVDLSKLAATSAKVTLGKGGHTRELPDNDTAMKMQARTVDQKAISAVIKADMRALQYCLESLRARGLTCGGDISLNFTIEPKGVVSSVKVSAAGANHAKVEACVAARVKAWKFPAADAPTTVSYPLVLESSASK
jgi:hypothetical protein